MQHKIHELTKAIQEKTAELGLVFVNGPDPDSVKFTTFPNPSHGYTNGQERETYGFAVAEKL
jgi:hypothetical protein